jgi:hypothetical protein
MIDLSSSNRNPTDRTASFAADVVTVPIFSSLTKSFGNISPGTPSSSKTSLSKDSFIASYFCSPPAIAITRGIFLISEALIPIILSFI